MAVILETEVTVGKDHSIVIELPASVTDQRVRVRVEVVSAPPSLEEVMKRPILWEIPQEFQGMGKIPPAVLEPLTPDEVVNWENPSL